MPLEESMKNLLIMRHAKSSWKDSNVTDHDRPLKKRGTKDAARMGKLLKDKGLVIDKILSSTAVRAADTAVLVAEKAGYKKDVEYSDSLYMAEGNGILDIIQHQPDDIKTLLLIGHNPGMEAFVQMMTKKIDSLSTASIAYFEADIEHWKDFNKDSAIKFKKFWQPDEL